jgi:hypothetical protein
VRPLRTLHGFHGRDHIRVLQHSLVLIQHVKFFLAFTAPHGDMKLRGDRISRPTSLAITLFPEFLTIVQIPFFSVLSANKTSLRKVS